MKIGYSEEKRMQLENLTTAERTAEPALSGRKVYDTDLDRLFIGDGTNWHEIPIDADLSGEYLEDAFQSYIKSATANTSLTDNANTNPRGLKFSDLRYQAGVTRIEVYSIELTDENMGDDLPVWKIATGCGPKGFRDQVRFVGTGWVNNVNATGGPNVSTDQDGDYFVVTGIMDDFAFLSYTSAGRADNIDVQVDGVDTGTNIDLRGSTGLNLKNVRTIQPISDSSIGTTISSLGLHTVKVIVGDSGSSYNMAIFGFDLIVTGAVEQAGDAFVGITETSFSQQSVSDPTLSNEMGAIAYRYIDTADSVRKWAYREPATASTTLTGALNNGTNSATVASSASFAVDDLVLVEDTSLGYTISQIFRVSSIGGATNLTFQDNAARTTQAGAAHNFAIGSTVKLYGKCDSGVDHDDEQISRSIHPRAFGAGHSGDWQYANGAGAYSYLMDDGISSLWSNDGAINIAVSQIQIQEGFIVDDGTTNRGTYIFNGTGIDILINQGTGTSDVDIYLDGVKIYDYAVAGTAEYKIIKLVSGLPMGTHILHLHQMSAVAGQNTPVIAKFIEYVPADPAAIASANAGNVISRRDFAADYVFNSGTGLDDFSKGVNYYGPTRGWKLTDSNTAWALAAGPTYPFYDRLEGIYDTTEAIAEKWFYGTGFELIVNANTNMGIHTLEIDGSNDFSSFTVNESLSKFTAVTGKLDAYHASSLPYKLGVTGLTLGWHKLKITQLDEKNGSSSAKTIRILALGVIGGSATLTSPVGALQQICTANAGDSLDLRKVKALESEENVVDFAQSKGITSGPTTSSTSPVPMPDCTVNIKSTGNPVEISVEGSFYNGAVDLVEVTIFRDGKAITSNFYCQTPINYAQVISFSVIDNVEAGIHSYAAYFEVNGGTATALGTLRSIKVVELTGVKNENS